jgi:hypothetical protein
MHVLVPPMLADLIAGAITVLDGAEFTRLRRCPACGREMRGHDMKRRRFAVIEGLGGRKEINVWVKRFRCTGCGTLCTADAPFYPGTRAGAPIVDLCLVLTEDYPFNHAARLLGAMRIVLDRGSVRNYASRRVGPVPSTTLYGLRLPISILSLIALSVGRDESGPVEGAKVLAACGFPSADRTPLHPLRPEEGDQRYEEKKKEEWKAQKKGDRSQEE